MTAFQNLKNTETSKWALVEAICLLCDEVHELNETLKNQKGDTG